MPELLSPAGNFEKLKAAVLYGADAVYFAGETFGMRAAADNFDTEQLAKAIKYCHDRGVRAFITVNVMPHEDEYPALKEYFKSLAPLSPDALIIADVGVIDLAKEYVPNAEIHISTQANTMSSAACRCWMKMGAKRIVLARELTFDEIRRIRDNIPPDLELEAFIHGSMCVSYSGRCLLSQYYTGRSANDGRCTQPCRWEYRFAEIAEVKRPDDVLTVCETPSGSFTLSSKDMCMIEHIPELIKSGIDSFKIEGRMKSAYYTAVTTNAYRMAIDSYLHDPEDYKFDPLWLRELESVSHREYDTGFFFGAPNSDPKTTYNPGYLREKAYIAVVTGYDPETGIADLEQRNKTSIGDTLELITPGKTGRRFVMNELWDEENNPIESAPHPKMKCRTRLPFEAKPGDIIRM